MKTVSFQYQTNLVFSSPASDHRFLLKILPTDDDRQRITDLSWHIDPEQESLWHTADSFGNKALSGYIATPHSHFEFGINGSAEMSGEPFIMCCDPERVLRYPSALTRPHSGIVEFYEKLAPTAPGGKSGDTLERVQFFSNAVHEHMRYERGITTYETPMCEAFDNGVGVCQDYAHILLALLRLDGFLCRYVAGLASDYGETHAWVEAWVGGRFYGIDPTRNKMIDESYLALSRGRDFQDCSVERGVYKGACKGIQEVSSTIVNGQQNQL